MIATTIYGDISYQSNKALDNALKVLETNGCINNRKWVNSETNAVVVVGTTLIIPFASYSILGALLEQGNSVLFKGALSYEVRLGFRNNYLKEVYSDEDGCFQAIGLIKSEYLHLLGYSKKDIELVEFGKKDWAERVVNEGILNGFRFLLKDRASQNANTSILRQPNDIISA